MTGHTSAIMAARDPDVRLMLRVRDANDQAAFTELVERFQHRLVGVMHQMVGNLDESEELAQEVFLRVYRTRNRYTPKAKFATWLFTIANNLALNSLRDRHRRQQMSLPPTDSGSLTGLPGAQLECRRNTPPPHRLQRSEVAAEVSRALASLSERQRMAVILNKFEDMSYAEIGEVMGLSPKAVKSLLCRARCKLRQSLQKYIQTDDSPSAPGVNGDDHGNDHGDD